MLLMPVPSMAADEMPNYAADTLTGDWGGTRTALFKKGLALDIGYKADLLRNMSGGIEKGGRPMSHIDIKLNADLDKLIGWSGGTGYVNFIQDHGGKLNAQQVDSWTGVSNIEVGTNTNRLLHAWVQQEFAGGRGAVLMGLYPIDSEFATLDSAGLFVQPPYGATADIALTRGPSIFNTSSFGFRGKWYSANRSTYVMGAVLDGIPGDPNNPRGTHIKFNKGDGIMSIVEIGLKPAEAGELSDPATDVKGQPQKPEVAAHEAAERIEKYAAGLWRYSSRVADQFDTNADGSPINRLSWGWYALAEKTLYQAQSGRDLAGFLRISGTDGDSTPIKTAVNIGFRIKALLSGRGEDVFGLAYTRASLSDKWRSAQLAAGTATNAAEDAWEATYRIQAGKWLAVQPLVQHINHPGGDASRAAANILGARVEIAF
jgi:porin